MLEVEGLSLQTPPKQIKALLFPRKCCSKKNYFNFQIHKEAEREKTQNQLLNELTPMRNRDGGGPQNMRGGPNDRRKPTRGPNQSDDGWTNVQPKTSQRSSTYDRIDSNKIANLAQSSQRRVSCSETILSFQVYFFKHTL